MPKPENELAFSDIIPIVEPRPKPRQTGLTEVRTPAHSIARIADYVDTLGPYLDSVKWTVGTQRLLPRSKVREINDYLHENQLEVSSGGLLESVLTRGDAAIQAYLEESKELGFDIIEISSAFAAISLQSKANIVKAVLDLGMKPKPEINAWSPNDRGHVSAEKVIREADVLLEAGAWTLMIEEDGIFSDGNEGSTSSSWNRDLAWKLATKIPIEKIYWEASSVEIDMWLINSFGPEVNLFGGDDQLGYIAAFRAGAFYLQTSRFGA